MSQQTIISVTTTDVVPSTDLEDTEVRYAVGQFSGAEWKLSIAEGFIILSARDGLGKLVVPAHRVREVEVTPVQTKIMTAEEFTEGPVALVDAEGREFIAED